jgi:hypothetical protein
MDRRRALILRLALYSFVALAFSLIPTEFVERGSLCIIYHLTGHTCPMCGMTRAFSNVFHLNFARAYEFNPLVTAVFPICVYVFVDEFVALLRRRHRSAVERLWGFRIK